MKKKIKFSENNIKKCLKNYSILIDSLTIKCGVFYVYEI